MSTGESGSQLMNPEVPPSRFPRPDYRELEPYDPARVPVSVDLSDNTNLWGPHPAALEAVHQASVDDLRRYPSVYADELKAAFARRHGVPRECVVTGCGSDDLLDSVFRAAAVPPGKLCFPDPTFSMVQSFARMNGLEVKRVPWSKAQTDPGRLLLDEPDLVYICRPNNPTGGSVPREWLHGLLALGGSAGPIVVLDEAYADFARDSFLEEAPASPRLLVVRTFSKLFGLAGLRVGVGVASPDLVREVEKSRGPYKVSGLATSAALAVLQDTSWWEERILRETLQNRDRLAEELRFRGLRPLPSQANFLLVPVEPASATGVNRALRERGVACRPFQNLPGVGDALRVTVGPWELMERFLSAMDDLLAGDDGPEGGPRDPDTRDNGPQEANGRERAPW